MRPEQRQVLVVVRGGEAAHGDELAADREPRVGQGELVALERDRGVALRGRGTQHGGRVGALPGRDDCGAGLDDPGLHGRDLTDRLPQPVGVIDVDRGEHGDIAVGGVGRIPRSAHAHFEDEHVDRRVGERDEGEHREQLEERERRIARCGELGVDEGDERRDLVPRVGDGGIGHRLSVDHDALGEALEMGAREQSGAQAVCADQALDDAARRSLAVRSGHVHDAVGALRVIEQLEDPAGALDTGLHPALALPLQQGGVDGVGATAIAHTDSSPFATARVTDTVKSPALANVPFGNCAV